MEDSKTVKKALIAVLLISLILRAIASWVLGFGNDESYYIAYALHPALSHFDHPPMVGFLIQLTTLNLYFYSEFAARLGAVILGTLSIIVMYMLGKKIKNERTGFFAACLGITSVYFSIVGGTFITPDPPLMFFILLSFYYFLDFITKDPSDASVWKIFLAFLIFGLAVYSKYQSVYLGLGVFLYVVIYNRRWLKSIYLYLFSLIPIFFLFLIIYWNYKHKFISATYQGGRVIDFANFSLVKFFLGEIGAEIGFYNPVNIFFVIAGIITYRKRKFLERGVFKLTLLCSIPLIATVLFIAMYARTLPHWVGISYMLLYLIGASYMDEVLKSLKSIKIYTFVVLAGMGVAIVVARTGFFFPGAYTPEKGSVYTKAVYNPPAPEQWETQVGRKDFSLDMEEWNKVNEIYLDFIKKYPKYKDYTIVETQWYLASHIDFYVAMPNKKKMLMYGTMDRLHEYYWLDQKRGLLSKGDDALCIVTSHDWDDVDSILKNYFDEIKLKYRAPIFRRGKIVEFVFIYELTGFTGRQNGT